MRLKEKSQADAKSASEKIKILTKDKELLTTEVEKLGLVIETLMGKFPNEKPVALPDPKPTEKHTQGASPKKVPGHKDKGPFKYILTHDYPVVHEHWITCCACTPDQKFIFTVSNDRTMKQWSTEELKLHLDYGTIHDGYVYQIKITPNGNHA